MKKKHRFPCPNPTTPEGWDEAAKRLGVASGAQLKAQTELADSIIEEILREEAEAKRDA